MSKTSFRHPKTPRLAHRAQSFVPIATPAKVTHSPRLQLKKSLAA